MDSFLWATIRPDHRYLYLASPVDAGALHRVADKTRQALRQKARRGGILAQPVAADLSNFDRPTLLLAGSEDRLIPNAETFAIARDLKQPPQSEQTMTLEDLEDRPPVALGWEVEDLDVAAKELPPGVSIVSVDTHQVRAFGERAIADVTADTSLDRGPWSGAVDDVIAGPA